MSNSPTHDGQSRDGDESADSTSQTDSLELEDISPSLATPIRRTGFWMAIVLPFLYVPLLARGLSTSTDTIVFLTLLGLNLLALYVGHAHRR